MSEEIRYRPLKGTEKIQKGDQFKTKGCDTDWQLVEGSIGTAVFEWFYLEFRRPCENIQNAELSEIQRHTSENVRLAAERDEYKKNFEAELEGDRTLALEIGGQKADESFQTFIKRRFDELKEEIIAACQDWILCSNHPRFPSGKCRICNGTRTHEFLLSEIERLKEGKWTQHEVHNLCHNLHGVVDVQGFAEGCKKEITKIYGKCPWMEKEKAFRDLVAALDKIHENDEYRGVWIIAQIHRGPYNGPTYTKELKKAKELLNHGTSATTNQENV